jgi:hypothetical protein
MKRQVVLSNWRDDLSEYVNLNNVTPKKAKTDTRAKEKVEEKDVKNKVVINPTMSEAFEELGGIIISVTEELSKEEMEEMEDKKEKKEGRKPGKVEEASNPEGQLADIDKRIAMQRLKRARVEKQQAKKNQGQNTEMQEKLDLKKADMGDVITDFRKSDAPQFKGKSDKKIQKMAIAAKLEADGKPLKSESAALEFMKNKYKDSLITPSKPKAPSPGTLKKRAANRAANQKSGPMAQDPYKSRAGESD